jgi:hypothetical protein
MARTNSFRPALPRWPFFGLPPSGRLNTLAHMPVSPDQRRAISKWLKACIAAALPIYAVITYGGWYWATRWHWEDRVGQNGCLSLAYVGPTLIEGTVVSPSTTGSIRTEISGGFPILLFIDRAKFEIPGQGVGGHVSLSIGLNEIAVYQHYDSRGGPANVNAPPIRFSRVSTCASQGSH